MPINPEFLARLAAKDPSATKMELQPGRGITLAEIKQLVEAAKDNTYFNTLILVDQGIDDDIAVALSDLQNIEILTLEANRITDIGVKALAKMPKLVDVGLGGNYITNEGAKDLASLKITSLDLYANDLTNEVRNVFLNNHTLTYLRLVQNKIDEHVLQEIEKHIENNRGKIPDLNIKNSQTTTLAIEAGQAFFNQSPKEAKEQITEITSPTEQNKIKTSVINQLNSLPENTRKEFIETLMKSCGLSNASISAHKQTYVK